MPAFLRDNLLNLWLLARDAQVFVARTDRAGPPPAMWSGFAAFDQALALIVEETVFGARVPEGPKTVRVPVVEGARTADVRPGLAPWITEPGARNLYFLTGDQIADENLSVLPASAEAIEALRRILNGPPPPGAGAVLRELSLIAAEDPRIGRAFAAIAPAVMDVIDGDRGPVRLTVSGGALRVFSGIAFEHAARDRGPDVTLHAGAEALARALSGEGAIAQRIDSGSAPSLIAALDRAAAELNRDPAYKTRLRDAASALTAS